MHPPHFTLFYSMFSLHSSFYIQFKHTHAHTRGGGYVIYVVYHLQQRTEIFAGLHKKGIKSSMGSNLLYLAGN